jgi:2-polyprenyl-3-methyl-5-hydroxy-6-metoxy-1,4-benzoquinol methylase
MPSLEYHEALWQTVPQGSQPPDLAIRSRFLLQHVKPGERVLDVGCGEGHFTTALTHAGAHALGIDVAREPLRRAHARDGALRLQLVADAQRWPLADAAFDTVWAGEVIEHVADTAAWLSEVRRVLRSGGSLLLSTPAHQPLTLMHVALSKRAFARRFDPRGDHLRFYSRQTLTRLIAEFGFEQVSVRSVGGLPGARRLLLAHALRSRF